MTSGALDMVSSGAPWRPAGTPSLPGLKGGHRSFSSRLAAALPRSEEIPSGTPRSGEAGRLIDAYGAFWVNQMIQAMRSSTLQSEDGFGHGGRAEQVFQGEQDRELARRLASSLGFRRFFSGALERLERTDAAAVEGTSRLA